MSETDDLVDALAPVIAALQALHVSHYVGGSVASESVGVSDLLARLLEQT